MHTKLQGEGIVRYYELQHGLIQRLKELQKPIQELKLFVTDEYVHRSLELWLGVKDFPDYLVSNYGRVRNIYKGKVLKLLPNNTGYYTVNLYANSIKRVQVHRLVAIAFIENPNNKSVVDHINGNIKDNSIFNLRWATVAENNRNSKLPITNTSGVKGVHYNKKNNTWIAIIGFNSKKIHIGTFKDKQDAIDARRKREEELFGEYNRK